MRNTVLIITLLLIYSCQSGETQKELAADTTQPEQAVEDNESKVEEENNTVEAESKPCENDLMVVENTDPFNCKDYGDSIVYIYDKFTVKTVHHPEFNGNIIEIRYPEYGSKVIIGEENSAFFMGLVGNNALIDEGTSQMRTLFIYDAIINDKLIFTDAYVGGLKMEDGFLLFDQQIDAEFVDPKPECSEELKAMEDNLGYVGVYKYDFKAKGISFTGEYRCQYFEY